MVLFGLFFQPVGIAVKDTLAALREAKKVSPAVRKLGEGAIPFDGGFYPVILQNYVCAECMNVSTYIISQSIFPILPVGLDQR